MIDLNGTSPYGTSGVAANDPRRRSGRPTGGYSPGMDTKPYTPPPGMPQTGGATPGTFSPGNNLIDTQFSPNPSGRLRRVRNTADSAFQNAQNYQFSPFSQMQDIDTTGTRNNLAAGNSLIQQQTASAYSPVAGTNLTRSRSLLGGANPAGTSGAGALGGMGQTGSFAYNADTGDVRGMAVGQLKRVLNDTPDRATLASNSFQRLIDESTPQFEQDLRRTTQRNAAMGRAGSGMVTQDLGTVQQRREEMLGRERGRLADEAAARSLADQMDKLGAAQGLSSELAGQDVSAGGLNLSYMNAANDERGRSFDRLRSLDQDTFRNTLDLAGEEARLSGIERNDGLTERDARIDAELRGNDVLRSRGEGMRRYGMDTYGLDQDSYGRRRDERDAGMEYDQRMFDNRRRLFDDARGYDEGITAQERSDRNELRGERDYQYGLDRDALNDSRYDQEYADRRFDQRWNRGLDLYGAGFDGSPVNMYNRRGEQEQDRAQDSYGAAGDLFQQYAYNRGMRGRRGSTLRPPTRPVTPDDINTAAGAWGRGMGL